jgi:hypothetical protein
MSTPTGTPEIPEEVRRFLTDAKRHHYVAEFHQRRFSSAPAEEHPQIHRLDVRTGKTSRTSTINSCVIQHHNTFYETPGLPRGFAEAVLSAVEADAAPVVEKLVAAQPISEKEEVALALFVYFQQQRTPRGREYLNFMLEQGAKYWMLKQIYEGRDVHRSILVEELGREPTEDEVAASIKAWSEDFETGRRRALPTRDHEVGAMFISAERAVPVILGTSWTLIEAGPGEAFILSDEPLLRVDATHPGASSGWLSSPTVETTLPLDPQLLLLMRPLPQLGRERVTAHPGQVMGFNLRTYASAREFILGPTQGLLQKVRIAAKKDPVMVASFRQRPPSVHLLDSTVGDRVPPTVTTTRGPTTVTIRRHRESSGRQRQ